MSPIVLHEATVAIDRPLVKLAKRVRVLSTLAWPPQVEAEFLDSGPMPSLPQPPPIQVDLGDTRAGLIALRDRCDLGHPLQAFLARTAESYVQATRLLESAGTPDFQRHSVALYGHPDQPIVSGAPSHLDEAEHLLNRSDALRVPMAQATLSDEEARDLLQQGIDLHFTERLPVVLDPHMASLAAASSVRVRLRAGVRYAPIHIAQLLQHEALVHSATKRNGKSQAVLTALGLSSPRTTATQEGLATLAEMITDVLDLQRLRRITLRVRALSAALDGADFIQVYNIFREADQPDREAFRSAMRLFRGGDVRGGVVFTKDVVYLRGLSQVHTFLLAAFDENRVELAQTLFSGRMTLGDAVKLQPFVDDGTLAPPQVMPPWATETSCLAAYLTWSAFGHRIPLQRVSLADFQSDK
ncbi:MAG: DUF1704 domain-containing protein [Rhodobacterales bacterium]|nr:DUF1704 domain-containing protein [Rhodobacterales bacterium]